MKQKYAMQLISRLLTVILLLTSPAALAAQPALSVTATSEEVVNSSIETGAEDPFEDFNRAVFAFNMFVDTLLLRPLAEIYSAALPSPLQDGVHNFLGNISSPITFINNVLQGEGSESMDTLARFLINTTLGIGGLFDVATSMGLEERPTDLGITLGKAGIESGPYLMLPILGPCSLRDALGWGLDYWADPVNYYARHHHHKKLVYARSGADLLDRRVKALDFMEKVEQTSSDPYITYRSYYLQNRRYKVAPQAALDDDSPSPYENKDEQ